MNRGCVSGLRRPSQRAWFSLSISLVIFPVIPDNSVYCVCFFFFLEMRCVQFLNLTTTFGDLPTSLGFEWGLCPVLLSFKFTFNMFLFSAPLAHWGLLFGSLKFAASRGSSAGRWSYCKFFLDLWQREWSVKARVMREEGTLTEEIRWTRSSRQRKYLGKKRDQWESSTEDKWE